ncbi:MAG: hypothetical protein WBM51_14000, partial [Pseudolabrys sp.]
IIQSKPANAQNTKGRGQYFKTNKHRFFVHRRALLTAHDYTTMIFGICMATVSALSTSKVASKARHPVGDRDFC